jgi:hypothetical protein
MLTRIQSNPQWDEYITCHGSFQHTYCTRGFDLYMTLSQRMELLSRRLHHRTAVFMEQIRYRQECNQQRNNLPLSSPAISKKVMAVVDPVEIEKKVSHLSNVATQYALQMAERDAYVANLIQKECIGIAQVVSSSTHTMIDSTLMPLTSGNSTTTILPWTIPASNPIIPCSQLPLTSFNVPHVNHVYKNNGHINYATTYTSNIPAATASGPILNMSLSPHLSFTNKSFTKTYSTARSA